MSFCFLDSTRTCGQECEAYVSAGCSFVQGATSAATFIAEIQESFSRIDAARRNTVKHPASPPAPEVR